MSLNTAGSFVGLLVFGAAAFSFWYGAVDGWKFLGLATFGFVFFKHEYISRIAIAGLRVEQQVKRVESAVEGIRSLCKPLVKTLYLYIGTDNLHPPSITTTGAIREQLLEIAALAFPDKTERDTWIAELDRKIEQEQNKGDKS